MDSKERVHGVCIIFNVEFKKHCRQTKVVFQFLICVICLLDRDHDKNFAVTQFFSFKICRSSQFLVHKYKIVNIYKKGHEKVIIKRNCSIFLSFNNSTITYNVAKHHFKI